jgi:hypothetical protein
MQINLGKDTQRWRSLSAHCSKAGDFVFYQFIALYGARGRILQTQPTSLIITLEIYLNNYVFSDTLNQFQRCAPDNQAMVHLSSL